MSQRNPIKFLLNEDVGSAGSPAAVSDPAFSITKVMATAALVLTPVATVITDKVTSLTFSSSQVVVLVVAVLGLLAITAAADVLARALATSSRSRQDVISIEPALTGTHIMPGEDQPVHVIAVRRFGESTQYLTVEGNDIGWLDRAALKLGA